MPYNLRVLPKFLPEGVEDAASVIIGQLEGKPFTLKIWRDDKLAYCNMGNPPISAEIMGDEEVILPNITGL